MNISATTYKKKFGFLVIGIIVAFVLSYYLAIKKTVTLYGDCRNMELKLDMIGEAPKKIKELKSEIARIDELVSTNDTSSSDFRQLLLERTGDYCGSNNITLKEFPESIYTVQNDYLIETNTIVLNGAFSNMLKYTYMLEQKCKIGKVVSADFSAKFDLALKKTILTEKIYVQNIKKKKDEK